MEHRRPGNMKCSNCFSTQTQGYQGHHIRGDEEEDLCGSNKIELGLMHANVLRTCSLYVDNGIQVLCQNSTSCLQSGCKLLSQSSNLVLRCKIYRGKLLSECLKNSVAQERHGNLELSSPFCNLLHHQCPAQANWMHLGAVGQGGRHSMKPWCLSASGKRSA